MKTTFKLLVFLLAACAAAGAQAVPAATVRSVPITGELQYGLNYSQMAEFSSGLGDWQMSTVSGSAAYANGKDRFPFSMEYGGGYTWIIAGPSYGAGLFQHLFLSQGIVWRKWNVTASNDISYLPEAPITGFSGIPGIGEPIGVPSPAPPSGQSILTLNTVVIDNNTQGELGHTLNYATSLNVGGSYNIFRYPDGNGLDMNMVSANAELTRRLNARNSLMGTYMYSQFSYPQYNFSLTTNSGTLGFQRVWNRKITTNISAGPQWLSSSDAATVPSSVGITANASINYQFQLNSASLVYSHGISGGGGYLVGAELDSVLFALSRQFGRKVTVGANAGYMRTASLGNVPIFGAYGAIDAEFAGVQATRQLGRYFNMFANYTAITQSSGNSLPSNVLNQLMQTVSFGIGYSPRSKHLRQ
ncbi:MAG TPA: hypothetical protein VFN62_06010 [Acidobacteriaceae bacterium]|nr:hypothetical protein [Acidobacteriaceae bacterium]